jgi:hypothetical protein
LREDSSSSLSEPPISSKTTSPSPLITSIVFVTLGDSIPYVARHCPVAPKDSG